MKILTHTFTDEELREELKLREKNYNVIDENNTSKRILSSFFQFYEKDYSPSPNSPYKYYINII